MVPAGRRVNAFALPSDICEEYIAGFCTLGTDCEKLHKDLALEEGEYVAQVSSQIQQAERAPSETASSETTVLEQTTSSVLKSDHRDQQALICASIINKTPRMALCQNFVNGFCTEGEDCPYLHTLDYISTELTGSGFESASSGDNELSGVRKSAAEECQADQTALRTVDMDIDELPSEPDEFDEMEIDHILTRRDHVTRENPDILKHVVIEGANLPRKLFRSKSAPRNFTPTLFADVSNSPGEQKQFLPDVISEEDVAADKSLSAATKSVNRNAHIPYSKPSENDRNVPDELLMRGPQVRSKSRRQKYKSPVRVLRNPKEVVDKARYHCFVCARDCESKSNYNSHIRGKAHKKAVAKKKFASMNVAHADASGAESTPENATKSFELKSETSLSPSEGTDHLDKQTSHNFGNTLEVAKKSKALKREAPFSIGVVPPECVSGSPASGRSNDQVAILNDLVAADKAKTKLRNDSKGSSCLPSPKTALSFNISPTTAGIALEDLGDRPSNTVSGIGHPGDYGTQSCERLVNAANPPLPTMNGLGAEQGHPSTLKKQQSRVSSSCPSGNTGQYREIDASKPSNSSRTRGVSIPPVQDSREDQRNDAERSLSLLINARSPQLSNQESPSGYQGSANCRRAGSRMTDSARLDAGGCPEFTSSVLPPADRVLGEAQKIHNNPDFDLAAPKLNQHSMDTMFVMQLAEGVPKKNGGSSRSVWSGAGLGAPNMLISSMDPRPGNPSPDEEGALSKMTLGHWKELRHMMFSGKPEHILAFKILQELLVSPTIGISLSSLAPLSNLMDKQVRLVSDDNNDKFLRTESLPPAFLSRLGNAPSVWDSVEESLEMETAAMLFVDNAKYVFHPLSKEEYGRFRKGPDSSLPCRGNYGEHKELKPAQKRTDERVVADHLFVHFGRTN